MVTVGPSLMMVQRIDLIDDIYPATDIDSFGETEIEHFSDVRQFGYQIRRPCKL